MRVFIYIVYEELFKSLKTQLLYSCKVSNENSKLIVFIILDRFDNSSVESISIMYEETLNYEIANSWTMISKDYVALIFIQESSA